MSLIEGHQDEENQGRKDSGFATSIGRTLTSLSLLKSIETGEDWKISLKNSGFLSKDLPEGEGAKILFLIRAQS